MTNKLEILLSLLVYSLGLAAQTDSTLLARLKVQAAILAGMDTTPHFLKEMKACHRQLLYERLSKDAAPTEQTPHASPEKRVYICQLFKRIPQNATPASFRQTRLWMDSLSACLNEHPDKLQTYIQQFSDAKDSIWIHPRQVTIELEEQAFSLKAGELSAPFLTPEGIHIIAVLKKENCIQSCAPYPINSSLRPSASTLDDWKRRCHYTPQEGIEELLTHGKSTHTLFTIAEKPYTGEDFARFASAYPASRKRQLELFTVKSLLDYQNETLEQRDTTAHRLLESFREKRLVELITEREVIRPSQDEEGIRRYFAAHHADYQWEKPRFKGCILYGDTKRTIKRAKKFLRKLQAGEWSDAIRLTFNADRQSHIRLQQGIFTMGENEVVDALFFKRKGVMIQPDEAFPFVDVLGEKLTGPESYQEIRSKVTDDYRNYLQQQWERALRTSAKVEIDQQVLKTVNNH